MKKLKVVSAYRNRRTVYAAGEVIDVAEQEAAFLLKDAPGCFEEVKPKTKKKTSGRTTKPKQADVEK